MGWVDHLDFGVEYGTEDKFEITKNGIRASRIVLVSVPRVTVPATTSRQKIAAIINQDAVPKLGEPYFATVGVGPFPTPVCTAIRIEEIKGAQNKSYLLYELTCDYELVIGNEELSLIEWVGPLYGLNVNSERVYYEGTEGSVRIDSANLSARYGDGEDSPIIGDSEDGSIAGTEISEFHSVLVVEKHVPAAGINFEDILAARGRVNDDVFYGHPAGECLFVSMREMGRTAPVGWDLKVQPIVKLEYRFLISKNLVAADLPTFTKQDDSTFTVTDGKKGWQYMWIKSRTKGDGDKAVVRTEKVQIHDVYADPVDLVDALAVSGVMPDYAAYDDYDDPET